MVFVEGVMCTYVILMVFASAVYGVAGLLMLGLANDRWEDGFDEVMGSVTAQFIGWLVWPLSLCLIAACHRVALCDKSADE